MWLSDKNKMKKKEGKNEISFHFINFKCINIMVRPELPTFSQLGQK